MYGEILILKKQINAIVHHLIIPAKCLTRMEAYTLPGNFVVARDHFSYTVVHLWQLNLN